MGSPPDLPLEVAVVRPTLGQGGADRVTVTLLEHLDRRQFRCSLVLMQRTGELLGAVPTSIPVVPLASRSLWSAWWKLAAHLRAERPDVVLSTSSGMNIAAALACRMVSPRPRLVLSERTSLERRRRPLKDLLLKSLKRVTYPAADRITTVSQGVSESLVTGLGLPRGKITTVYSPVVDGRVMAGAGEPLRHPWFTPEHPTILAAGRLEEVKDFATLIRAFARVREEVDSSRLVILGEGTERPALEGLVRQLGCEESVRLPGFDENPFRFMSRCTAFALSSRFEGLPGVLIQAMACGAPVVSTDCRHGPSEIVDHGRNGLLVPVSDVPALAGALGRVLQDPRLRERLASEGARTAGRFSPENVVPRYAEALRGDTDPSPGDSHP